MDPARDAPETKPAPNSLSYDTSSSDDPAAHRSNFSPNAGEVEKRAMDHDSLVTVRLSEPPSLHINTSIPPSLLPSRKTVYGIEYTPTDVMTESVEEEGSGTDLGGELETPTSGQSLNLQDELEQSGSTGDAEDAGAEQAVEERTSSDSETVDWDQLQKTEEMESQDQDSDKVRLVAITISADPDV
jgi:hypothetical protein